MKYGVNRQTLLLTAGIVWLVAGANILRIGLMTWFDSPRDFLFKVGNAFLDKIFYNGLPLQAEWQSGKPAGNICLLCRCENGYLVPLFDAINKKEA